MLKPDAVATPGTFHGCGELIRGFFVVLLCDDCMDRRLAQLKERQK